MKIAFDVIFMTIYEIYEIIQFQNFQKPNNGRVLIHKQTTIFIMIWQSHSRTAAFFRNIRFKKHTISSTHIRPGSTHPSGRIARSPMLINI